MQSGWFCLFCRPYSKFCAYLQTSHSYYKSVFFLVLTSQSIPIEMINTLHLFFCLHNRFIRRLSGGKNRLYWHQQTFKDDEHHFMFIFIFL